MDPARVAQAWLDAQTLAIALAEDATGDKFREELEKVITRVLDPAEDDNDYYERLGYLLYGLAMFASLVLAAAEHALKLSREQTLALLGSSLDTWLEQVC